MRVESAQLAKLSHERRVQAGGEERAAEGAKKLGVAHVSGYHAEAQALEPRHGGRVLRFVRRHVEADDVARRLSAKIAAHQRRRRRSRR